MVSIIHVNVLKRKDVTAFICLLLILRPLITLSLQIGKCLLCHVMSCHVGVRLPAYPPVRDLVTATKLVHRFFFKLRHWRPYKLHGNSDFQPRWFAIKPKLRNPIIGLHLLAHKPPRTLFEIRHWKLSRKSVGIFQFSDFLVDCVKSAVRGASTGLRLVSHKPFYALCWYPK